MAEDKQIFEVTVRGIYGSPLLGAIDIPYRHNEHPMQFDYREFFPLGRLEYVKGLDTLGVSKSAKSRILEIREQGYTQFSPSKKMPNAFIRVASQRMPDTSIIQYIHVPSQTEGFEGENLVSEARYDNKEGLLRVETKGEPLLVQLEECILAGRLHSITHSSDHDLRRIAERELHPFMRRDDGEIINPSLVNSFMPIVNYEEGTLGMFGWFDTYGRENKVKKKKQVKLF